MRLRLFRDSRLAPVRALLIAISVAWFLGGWPGGFLKPAQALQGYMDAFNSLYNTTSSRLNTCTVCHVLVPGGIRNSYGLAFENQANHGSDPAGALQNIELLNSDNFGVANLAEITARSFPGSDSDEAPLASAGADRTVAEGQPVTLNGLASVDRDSTGSTSVTFDWTQIGGPSVSLSGATSAQPGFTAPAVGGSGAILMFQVRVTDDETSFATATVSITVRNNLPPVVDAGTNATVLLFVPAKLSGSVSDDASPGALTTSWTKVSGPGAVTFVDATAVTTAAYFDEVGVYILRLTASDGTLTGSDNVRVTVTAPPPYLVALPDVNGNGAADIAVLVHDTATSTSLVFVKDGRNGGEIEQFALLSGHTPLSLAVIPDINGNGVPNDPGLAVLGIDGMGNMRVQVRRAKTGALINTVLFPKDIPRALAVLSDLNANNSTELVVLSSDRLTTENTAYLKDSVTETSLGQRRFLTGLSPVGLAVLAAIDSDGDGPDDGPGLAVLGLESSTGEVLVQIRQALNGAQVQTVSFPQLVPQSLSVVPDLNANGVDELAVLASDPATAKNYVYIKDAQTGVLLKRVSVLSNYTPVAFGVVPDITGGAAEVPALAVLGVDSATSEILVQVRRAFTGVLVQQRALSPNYTPLSLAVMEDVNGNGTAELAILRQRKADEGLQVRIIDARTGVSVKTIAIP